MTGIPAVLFFLMLFTIPRSLRWLVKKASIQIERGDVREKLLLRKHAFPIFLAVTIGILNQLSGDRSHSVMPE